LADGGGGVLRARAQQFRRARRGRQHVAPHGRQVPRRGRHSLQEADGQCRAHGRDVEHAHLLFDVARKYAKTDHDIELILDGARRSWAIDRIWKGHLADILAVIPA